MPAPSAPVMQPEPAAPQPIVSGANAAPPAPVAPTPAPSAPPPSAAPPASPPAPPQPQQATPAPQEQVKTTPTTESPQDTVSMSPTGQVQTPQPKTVVSGPSGMTNPPQTTQPVPIKFEEISSQLSDSKVPAPQRQQFAQKFLQDHVGANQSLIKGFRDIQGGNANTPEAQQYQAQLKTAENDFVKQHVDEAIKNNPSVASNPQEFGSFVSQAANNAYTQFQNAPLPMQLMMGIGLPLGLIGAFSSLFGEGGLGSMLTGVLGLGAAGIGGAATGMFGQNAQNMSADALYNTGTFLGMIPEKADLSALKGEDALSRLTAGPSAKEMRETWWDPQSKVTGVQQKLDQAEQVKKLMMVPEGMRPQLLRRLDPSLSEADAVIAARNAAELSKQMGDPDSAVSKTMQQGRDFVANPNAVVRQKTRDALYDYTMGNSYAPWNWGKESSDIMAVSISDLIEKWAREHEHRAANLDQKEVAAVVQKAARCWAGYEPVPGAKAYSKGSCRPKGSKKTQKEMKKS